MSFREVKRQSRRDLHEALRVPAIYRLETDPDEFEDTPIHVRVHSKFDALGDLGGTTFNAAELHEIAPRMVFDSTEIVPIRGAVVSVEVGEAYRIDNTQPKDDAGFIIADVLRLSTAETAGLPVPV